MKNDLIMVMDCGSTNLRVIAVDTEGNFVESVSFPNQPVQQPRAMEGWLIWDVQDIWSKLAVASRQVVDAVGSERIKAVTITTWGADGAPVSKGGSLTYPVISWQCSRTQELVGAKIKDMSAWEIFEKTGYQIISFNTLLRLLWLRENEPQALEEAETWMMMSGLLGYKLSGEFSIDPTSASTMMAMELKNRDWSDELLSLAGVDRTFFPRWVEPGCVIGIVTKRASEETGLCEGIPVVACGHDTQFAVIGSGASGDEAILSSGTWEILMIRSESFEPNRAGFENGLIIECDAQAGLWNPQMLMMASGVLEWVKKYFFADIAEAPDVYEKMKGEAAQVKPGSDNVIVLPSFVADAGPTKRFGTQGTILGLSLTTSRAQVYRAALEGLSFQLREALHILKLATNFDPRGVRVVGGGSKNELWNQIRADVTGVPVTTVSHREATVLGAAIVGFVGAGLFPSVERAQAHISFGETTYEPTELTATYDELYHNYQKIPRLLQPVYF